MKIISNENNPGTLKLQIAANVVQRAVDLDLVQNAGGDNQVLGRLPILELESGSKLFSTNAAAEYLIQIGSDRRSTIEEEEWLEWESSQLQPVLVSFLSSKYAKKSDVSLQQSLLDHLTELNDALKGNVFLTGSSLSIADVVLWSALFPLATDDVLSKETTSKYSGIQGWFAYLYKQEPVKLAVERLFPKGGGAEVCRASIMAMWVPSSVARSTTVEPSARGSISRESQTISPGSDVTTKEVPLSEEEILAAEESWLNGSSRKLKPNSRSCPVLPLKGERNILVTSALPYVNNVPHLGNIIGCVLSADVFARFCRLMNYNTLYICGTDEYGTATETKALEEKLTPRQICDKYYKIHEAIYKWFNISFDHFGRTTTPQQTKICQHIFLQLNENGFISSDSMEQLLCQQCDRYLADRFVEGICPFCAYEDARGDQCDQCGHLINATELKSPRCKVCQATPVVRESKQFFLELPKIEPMLKEWMEEASKGWTNNARVIARSWVKDGLKSRCISRDLKWGIPVPIDGYRDKVFYVWFDAPIGYISITMAYTDQWEKWWKNPDEVTYYEFMAKDNVPFHSVVFPSSQLGTRDKYTMVNHLMATEYLNYEDGKFSKSRGIGVFGNDAQGTGIPSDVWRFYLLFVRPESQDSTFSWADLMTKNNSELLNNLGNFINRALMFVEKNFKRQIPEIELNKDDKTLLAYVQRELKSYIEMLEKARLREGIRYILNISRHGNQYMQFQQPWVLVKGSDEERKRAGTIVGLSANIACLLSILLHPYMPETSKTIQEQLQAPADVNVISSEFACLLPPGHTIGKPSPLFQKIEASQIEKLKKQFSGRQKSSSPEAAPAKEAKKPEAPKVIMNGAIDEAEVQRLQAAVTQQGNVVRDLKSSGAEKSKIQHEVGKLLELKTQLSLAEGKDPMELKKSSGKKKGKK